MFKSKIGSVYEFPQDKETRKYTAIIIAEYKGDGWAKFTTFRIRYFDGDRRQTWVIPEGQLSKAKKVR